MPSGRIDGIRTVESPPSLLIAGAGIAGLAAALALARRGIGSTVFEQVPEPSEVGAGLQLGPNAVRALQTIGVAWRLDDVKVAPAALVLRRGKDGTVLGRVPLGAMAAGRYGAPYWVVHRADLHGALFAAAMADPLIAIETGKRVTGFREEADRVTVMFGADAPVHGLGLIGADGVWSCVRAQMLPDVMPVPSGFVAYRAVFAPDEVHELGSMANVGAWFAPDAHLVHYPIRAGGAVNVVVIVRSAWSDPSWSTAADRHDVARALSSFPAFPAGLADRPGWLKWSLAQPLMLPSLARGRIALLGDAGHATLPFLAQGAAMALEGAVVLADAIADGTGDVRQAFALYDGRRRARVRRVQERSSRNAQIFHLSGPMAAARDAVIGALPEALLLRQWDWLYGYKV